MLQYQDYHIKYVTIYMINKKGENHEEKVSCVVYGWDAVI